MNARLRKFYLTHKEAEQALGCSYHTLWRMRQDGTFVEGTDWVTYLRRVYIKKTSIERFEKAALR